MKKFLSCVCILCALCVLTGGIALADCGIGDAAVYAPVNAAPAAAPLSAAAPAATEAVLPAVSPVNNPADTVGENPDYATANNTKGFVYRMYTLVLGREPDPTGFSSWVAALDGGTATAADLVYGFFNSPEYLLKGKSSEAVITDCYYTMLNRAPDALGMASWKQALDIGMTSDVVCAGFVGSTEFINLANQYGIKSGTIQLTKARDQNYERTAFVYRLYQDCLNRAPEIEGLETWCAAIGRGVEGTTVASGFIFSQEYSQRMSDNETFVDMLYRTILGRVADYSGLSSWARQLDYTSTREKVLNGFMFSAEFAGKCAVAGIKLGQKITEPDDTREWKANILMLSLVNEERAKLGLMPVRTREDLWKKVACVRAQEIKTYFAHIRPNGTECWTAYSDAGFIQGEHYGYAGENIAYGYKTEQDVMKAWMESAGHRENILRAQFTTLATGLYGGSYWSQNFMEEYAN